MGSSWSEQFSNTNKDYDKNYNGNYNRNHVDNKNNDINNLEKSLSGTIIGSSFYNPFDRSLIFPECPKCEKQVENKCLCIHRKSPLDQNIDRWSHIQCANCLIPSSNGYYCDNETNGTIHGAYTNIYFPSYSIDGKYYCQDCHYILTV